MTYFITLIWNYAGSVLAAQTQQSAIWIANVVRTAEFGSQVRLCKSPFIPNAATTRDELLAAEADFSGYPLNGLVAVWNPILIDPNGGISTNAEVIFSWLDPEPDPVINNTVTSGWVETPGGMVVMIFNITPNAVLAGAAQGMVLHMVQNFGRNGPPA